MPDVKLKIAEGAKDKEGWQVVTASDGAEYSYKYTGGGDNKGNQIFQGDKKPEFFCIVFSGKTGDSYQFMDFNDKTPDSDLYGVVNRDGTCIAVIDLCDKYGTFVYGAHVGVRRADRSTPEVTFECDPVVRNRPGQT